MAIVFVDACTGVAEASAAVAALVCNFGMNCDVSPVGLDGGISTEGFPGISLVCRLSNSNVAWARWKAWKFGTPELLGAAHLGSVWVASAVPCTCGVSVEDKMVGASRFVAASMILAPKLTSGIAEGRAGWGTMAAGGIFVATDGDEEMFCASGGAATASGDLALSGLRGVLVEGKLEGAARFGAVYAICLTSVESSVARFATG